MSVQQLEYEKDTAKIVKVFEKRIEKKEAKLKSKSLQLRQKSWRLRDVLSSRSKWKREAKMYKEQLSQVQLAHKMGEEEQAKLRSQLAQYKELASPNLSGHQFPSWQIKNSVEMYLYSSQGFRSIEQTWKIMSLYFPLRVPSHTTIRNWVMRVGYAKLHQPIEKADDWILILDYTLQMGSEQCLVILGVRQQDLQDNDNYHPQYHQVQVLDLSLTHWANTAHVQSRLTQVIQKTGQPLQIVADGAQAIRKGIAETAVELEQKLLYTYDISHLVGNQLKKLLKENEEWKTLEKAVHQVQKSTQQTTAGFLSPPSLRKTARYMNLFEITNWTRQIMNYQQKADFSLLQTTKQPDGAAVFQKRFGVLEDCKESMLKLQQLIGFVILLLSDLKTNGLNILNFKKWEEMEMSNYCDWVQQFWKSCLPELQQYVSQLEEGQTYLASSDIIESIFGQYKSKGNRQWLKGITAQILFIPALAHLLDGTTIENSLKNTPLNKVQEWFFNQRQEDSFLSKRRKAFDNNQKTWEEKYEHLKYDNRNQSAKVVRKKFTQIPYYATA